METNRLIAVIVRLVHGFIPDFTQRLLKKLCRFTYISFEYSSTSKIDKGGTKISRET